MFFLIPPNSAFHGLLEEFLFPSVKIQNFHHINNQFVIKISTFYDSPYSNLVEEIDKQEEVKEQKANLDNELQLLKQAISNLHDSIQKVEKARKDGTEMVKALNAAKDSMNTAVSAFCRAVTRAETTVLKVEMTDECQNAIKSAREELIKAETALLANHRRMLLQEYRNQNEELLSLIKSGKGGIPVTQSILVVGRHLVCHFIVFILESFAVTPSVVELLNASCIEQIKNVRQRPTFSQVAFY